MSDKEYSKIVKKISTKNNKLKNYLIASLSGGCVCLFGEILVTIMEKFCGLSDKDAIIWMMIILTFIAILFTSLGFFDKWVTKLKAGLIIPITGFAHSISSSLLDYKKDGLITGIGANVFKLAGSVILYGIVSAFVLAILKVVIYG